MAIFILIYNSYPHIIYVRAFTLYYIYVKFIILLLIEISFGGFHIYALLQE